MLEKTKKINVKMNWNFTGKRPVRQLCQRGGNASCNCYCVYQEVQQSGELVLFMLLLIQKSTILKCL